ncbi:MAG: class B sortase [Oscillospiraceae bacterium]|nr:class B sortase [Oscillospiraceae bacterium]
MKKTTAVIILCIFSVLGCASGYKIFRILHEYRDGENSYEELNKYALPPLIDNNSDNAGNDGNDGTDNDDNGSDNTDNEDTASGRTSVDFEKLRDINADTAAWVRIDGLAIDYPIVHGEDNEYYLTHLFNKEQNGAGCIFLDYRNAADFSDRNSVIYGHNMKNGSMFSELGAYKSQSFRDEHRSFGLFTPQGNYVIEIFAGYTTDSQDRAWDTEFDDDADFEEWIDERIQKSVFHSDSAPSPYDKILTLSTCSYEFDNAKFVLFGIIRENN